MSMSEIDDDQNKRAREWRTKMREERRMRQAEIYKSLSPFERYVHDFNECLRYKEDTNVRRLRYKKAKNTLYIDIDFASPLRSTFEDLLEKCGWDFSQEPPNLKYDVMPIGHAEIQPLTFQELGIQRGTTQ